MDIRARLGTHTSLADFQPLKLATDATPDISDPKTENSLCRTLTIVWRLCYDSPGMNCDGRLIAWKVGTGGGTGLCAFASPWFNKVMPFLCVPQAGQTKSKQVKPLF